MRKLMALSRGDRHLLAQTLLVVAAIRVALRVFPFRLLRPVLARAASPAGRGHLDAPGVDRVARAVGRAAARVPGATCLVRALATQILLARRGEASALHIGVARDGRGGVKGHAWLEHEGRVVTGHSSLDDFVPLSRLEGAPPQASALLTGAEERRVDHDRR
jgi:hypothetical protein